MHNLTITRAPQQANTSCLVRGQQIVSLFLLIQFLDGRHYPKEEWSSAARRFSLFGEGPWLLAPQSGCRQAPQEGTEVLPTTGAEEQAPGACPLPQRLEQEPGREPALPEELLPKRGSGVREADCCPPTPGTGLAENAKARTRAGGVGNINTVNWAPITGPRLWQQEPPHTGAPQTQRALLGC